MSTYTLHSRCMHLKAHAECTINSKIYDAHRFGSFKTYTSKTVDGQSVLNVRMFKFLKGHDQIVHMHT